MTKSPYLKLYPEEWLVCLRDESGVLRAIWLDILCMAKLTRFGPLGTVSIDRRYGFTDQHLARICRVSVYRWRESIIRLQALGYLTVGEANQIYLSQEYASWVAR